jgi:stearoyl-CoA desaturase (delta-9 desaturase)
MFWMPATVSRGWGLGDPAASTRKSLAIGAHGVTRMQKQSTPSESEGVSHDTPTAARGLVLLETPVPSRVRVLNALPIAVIHLVCVGIVWVGWSWAAVGVAAGLYLLRMFAITAFYHRYFSHRTFRVHRLTQFLFAFIGTTSAQRGPIWWAAHHREHHRHSEEDEDIHSPHRHGLLWSHLMWFVSDAGREMNAKAVPDLLKIPEIRFIDRYHMLGPLTLAGCMFALGAALERLAPSWGTNGWQMFVWGFGVSTTVLYHATFTINSLAHTIGRRRFATKDDSRNNLALALLTLGEGWHNNHHYFPGSARQGFYWWEVDPSYLMLRLMRVFGLVWDLSPVPPRVYEAAERHRSLDRRPPSRAGERAGERAGAHADAEAGRGAA